MSDCLTCKLLILLVWTDGRLARLTSKKRGRDNASPAAPTPLLQDCHPDGAGGLNRSVDPSPGARDKIGDAHYAIPISRDYCAGDDGTPPAH
jgi:hypothetical protein